MLLSAAGAWKDISVQNEVSYCECVCVFLQNLIGSCENKGGPPHTFCSIVRTSKKYIANLWKINNFIMFYFLR